MSSTKTQETKMPQWQEDFIRENILPLGVEIGSQEYTPYEGEMIARMTPLQEQAMSGFGNLNMGGKTYDQAIGVQSGLTRFDPTDMGAIGAVEAAQAPGQIGVNQLATTDFDAYMSPYTQNVINRSLETLGGAQEQALNKLGAQATAARAFGGSRQGVAEAGTREAYAKQAADLVAGLQEKAFTQALGSGQFDIGNVQQARALQSGQQMTANTLGQQAREAAAARAQAAAAANYQGQFQTAGIQSAAANAMGSLAGQRLQSEMAGLNAQMAAGEQARALEQAQLQSDYAMFEKEQAYPLTQLNALLAAGSGVPAGLGTVTTRDPFGGLTAVGNLLGGAGSAAKGYKMMYP